MKVGKYNIRADSHQFILEEAVINSTVKDGVKGPNYGEEQLTNPSYHTSWDGVVRKLAKLELMASVNEIGGIADIQVLFTLSLMQLEDEIKEALGRK